MIEETVAKIEAAIREARGADPKNKAELIAMLEKLKADVQRDMRSKDMLDKAQEGLDEAAAGFEAEHPRLAGIIGELSLMLAKIGI